MPEVWEISVLAIAFNEDTQTYSTRQSWLYSPLEILGFGVDPTAKGGAGGMDLYCTTPYPLVGECKAGKKVSLIRQLSS